MPTVSVCIPVYNTERFIADAVTSALSQTYQDLEIVIVDNASTDATPQILAGFTDPRIRLYRNEENIGPAGNFNRAVSLACGRYLKVLCADDVLYPTCVAQQVAILDADARAEIAVVSGARDVIDERGKRWLSRRFPGRTGWTGGAEAIRLTVRGGTNILGDPATILVRTETARAVGAFDPRYAFCLDIDLWCRLLSAGGFYVLDDVLSAFRVSDQSWSRSLANRQPQEFAQFIQDLHSRGVPLSALDRASGRVRAYVNAFLRQSVARVIVSSARSR